MREGAREGCFPRHRRGALRLRSFESTSMEESKAREKSLNGLSAWPTARFPPSPALFCISFSLHAPCSPSSYSFPSPFYFFLPWFIYPFCLSTCASQSLFRHPSLDGRLRGQPLVNLIISAAPDKRRRQNVIPARSRRSPLLISNSKRCRWLTRSYTSHRITAGLFLPPAGLQSYSDFPPSFAVPVYRRSFS